MWKDSEAEIDFLDFDYLIGVLKDIIDNEDLLPATIGVYGDWGSGKSSLIRLAMNDFEENKNIVCLNFNAWLFESYEDAKTSLLGSILDKICEEKTRVEKATEIVEALYKSIDKLKLFKKSFLFGMDIATTGGILSALSILINESVKKDHTNIKEKITENIKNELNENSIRNDIKEFRKQFNDLLEVTKIDKLIIFIDELDRCSPDTILSTLEAIRLFLFTGNTVFIIGADERQIAYAVKSKFREIKGQEIDIGKEYLEKLIQYPIRIPRLNSKEMEFYMICLLLQKKLESDKFAELIDYLNNKKRERFLDFNVDYELIANFDKDVADDTRDEITIAKQLSPILSAGLNGNPRQCKRFLNSLSMREKMASFRNVDLDRKVLAKIMLLEYFKPVLFETICSNLDSKGMSSHIKEIENNDFQKNKEYENDSWVKNWIDVEPSLSGINLTKYLYFLRESNKGFSTMEPDISKEGKEILKQLLSGSEIAEKRAIEESKSLGNLDLQKILEILYSKLMDDDNLDNNSFKIFMRFAEMHKDLQGDAIKYLKSINPDKIKIVQAPLITSFKNNLENKEIIDDFINGLTSDVKEYISKEG
ncbi:MAG: P-loop NTPase fold protein [Clostridia bacterium]|nr:P-loop NTPase fold protein [Clostridia bacterium]